MIRINKKLIKNKYFLIISFILFLQFIYLLLYRNEEMIKNAKKRNKFKNDAMEKAKKRSKEFKLDYNSNYIKDIEILIDTPKYN
jgi:hypothetical protein